MVESVAGARVCVNYASVADAARVILSEAKEPRPRHVRLRSAQGDNASDYLVFVASEGNDRIALVRFGGGTAKVEREETIGLNPTELVGPHGLYVAPDHRWYYVSTAHGTPSGALWKFSTETGEQAGRVVLGAFPATVQVAPNGHYAWVANFNLYGDHVPSSVSVVYTDDMLEVRRIPTCIMPHGSRLSPDGKRHYSVCMMNDALVEINADRMAVARHFVLTAGQEHGMVGGIPAAAMAMGKGDGHSMAPASRATSPARRPGRSRLPTDARSGSRAARRTTWWRSTSRRGPSSVACPRGRGSTTSPPAGMAA